MGKFNVRVYRVEEIMYDFHDITAETEEEARHIAELMVKHRSLPIPKKRVCNHHSIIIDPE